MHKKAYFFTLDALLALGILILGSFLIFTSYANVPSREQTSILAEDVLDFFATTKIEELNDPYAGIGGTLWQQGDITNSGNTLLQQLAEFYNLSKLIIAENFITSITADLVPPQYKFELWIDDTLVYPTTLSQGEQVQHDNSKDKTTILIPSRKIAYGILNNDLLGPYEIKVLVWQ